MGVVEGCVGSGGVCGSSEWHLQGRGRYSPLDQIRTTEYGVRINS